MFKAHLAAIIAMLNTITQDNSAVAALRQTRGIATVTASTLVAEIIDIRRFSSEDSLAGYCRNLIKRGMSPLEAYKRVARALVRVLYRTLNGLLRHDTREDTNSDEAGSDMASGQARSEECHQSNMPLPAQRHSTMQRVEKIKRDGAKPHVSRRPRKVALAQRRS